MTDRHFLITSFRLMDNDKYRRVMASNKGIEITYQFLRRHIIRAPMKDVYKREVFDKYFMKGKLASTINERDLAAKLFLSNRTVRRNIEILKENNFLKVGSLKVKPGGSKQRPQNVYVLGRWVSETDFKGEETTKEYLFVFDILDSILFDAK
jgi:hypothetical protein